MNEGFVDGQFTIQYAIRGPSGELYAPPEDPFRVIYGRPDDIPKPRHPSTFYTRADCEKYLLRLRERAAELGVLDWNGYVVQRLCSPFTTHDPAEYFVEEIEQWMEQQ